MPGVGSRTSSRNRRLIALALVALAGCKAGPNYQPPRVNVSPAWSLSDHPRMAGAQYDLPQWWLHFNDPTLNELVQRADAGNLSLKEAVERIQVAQANYRVIAGNVFPQSQTLDGSFSQARISENSANFFAFPGVFNPDLTPQNWAVGPALSWELDFWGRYQRAIESADASFGASVAARDAVRVLLMADIARTYVTLRMTEGRIQIAHSNREIRQATYQLAQEKQFVGLATAVDSSQAELILRQAEAVIPSLEIQRRQLHHRLSVLIGVPPADLTSVIGFTGQLPQPQADLAFGIPADLLRRRPDVRVAERELAAQSAKIGIAEAEFYPHISLVGNVGVSAADASDVFRSSSLVGLISPTFSWNILNYGRIKNRVTAEQAEFQRLAYAYQNSVLTAAREAEDAQVAYVYGFERLNALNASVAAATQAVNASMELYRTGALEYNRLYVLQAELLKQQDEAIQANTEISLSLIDLFRALGGGWENPSMQSLECNPQLANHPAPLTHLRGHY